MNCRGRRLFGGAVVDKYSADENVKITVSLVYKIILVQDKSFYIAHTFNLWWSRRYLHLAAQTSATFPKNFSIELYKHVTDSDEILTIISNIAYIKFIQPLFVQL